MRNKYRVTEPTGGWPPSSAGRELHLQHGGINYEYEGYSARLTHHKSKINDTKEYARLYGWS
jgi:hypothetical protein